MAKELRFATQSLKVATKWCHVKIWKFYFTLNTNIQLKEIKFSNLLNIMTSFKGKSEAIAISIERPTSRGARSSIDSNSTGTSLPGAVSPIIMSRFFNFNSPKKRVCTMDCDNCRAIAKQLRIEEGNQLNIPGNGGRRGSTPWSAPCSRKSSCPGPGILGKIQSFSKDDKYLL